ncbi:class I SAM-dependent methyltransferase [Streptomyces coeruleorubidus]|uniref:class I SAM-dependent methyltransferase n=1 Tax=Streptomyces coeruleorubidus TaxID=116188 RepID=UPI0033CB4D5F
MTGKTLQVAFGNREQARAWDGDEGAYWAQHADRFDRAVRAYTAHLLAAARIGPGDHVLDVGCGTGEVTRAAARRARAGRVLGVDLSQRMLDVARRRTAADGLGNAEFRQADAQVYPFDRAAFDVAVSRTGTMFFSDPVEAFGNLARALRPAGRLVQVVWQAPAHNEWFLAFTQALVAGRSLPTPPPEAPGPFSLADPDRVRTLLGEAGFTEPSFEALSAPMHFGDDDQDAFRFVAGLLDWMIEGLDPVRRDAALTDLRRTLREHRTRDGVLYRSVTWLITASVRTR